MGGPIVDTFTFVVNLTDRNGNPMIGVEVEAVDIALFLNEAPDPMHYIVAIETTDISGTATFAGLVPSFYFARPRVTHREDMRIQVQTPPGMGGGGKMCYAALVEKHGLGTHTTIQGAIDTLGINGGTIFICAGTYVENLTVAVDTDGLWLIGASRSQCIIVGTITTNAVLNHGIKNFRLEHLTLDGNAGTALLFNSAAGAPPTTIVLSDLTIMNAAVGIDFSAVNGANDVTIQNVDMTSTVADAGQFEVSALDISDCRWLVSGKGPYIGGSTAMVDTKISNSTFKGGSTYAMCIFNVNKLILGRCLFQTGGAGVAGILLGNGVSYDISDCIVDVVEGIGIDAGAAALWGLTLENIHLACAIPQATDRVGIDIGPNVSELVISGCRIKNFESYGIKLGATQRYVISNVVIINGGDCHSIYLGGPDYGNVTGCVLIGTGGTNTTYGIYGTAGTTWTTITGNTSYDHDDITNLVNGVDNNIVGGNNPTGAGGVAFHNPVTLDVNADTLLSLTVQELGLDLQAANLVFSGPAAGVPAIPTFRVLGDADIPAAIMRDAEHTAIGDAAPHHPAISLGGGSDPALSLGAGQVLTLADVLTPVEHTAIGDGAPHHPEVTLDLNVAAVFDIAAQLLSFDTQAHGFALMGPVAGAPDIPSFRALDVADLPGEAIVDGDFAPAEGFMRKTGAGAYTTHKSNLNSAANPGVNDDAAAGYSVGSVWINTTLDEVWQCVDSTNGAAVWSNLSAGGGGGPHALLSATHSDTTPAACVLGDLITGQAGPAWTRLGIGAAGEVLTVVGGVPAWAAAAGGVSSFIQDADADTKIQCEEAPDEDKIRMDVAGTERFVLQNASPHLTLTGDALLSGRLALFGASLAANKGLSIGLAGGQTAIDIQFLAGAGGYIGIGMSGVTPTLGTGQSGFGLNASAISDITADAAGNLILYGLRFNAGASKGLGATVREVCAVHARPYFINFGGTVTDTWGVRIQALFSADQATAVYTRLTGIEIDWPGNSKAVTVTALKVSDVTLGTNKYIAWFGPATPYVQIIGGAAPGANQTNLYLNENGTLRRVQWKDGAAIGAGDKVLVLV